MTKGKFITLYGVNNIGKSTQARFLIERLKSEGFDPYYLKYPVYELEPTGTFLNKTLRNKNGQEISEDELQMWFVLNRYQNEKEIKKLLSEGKIVIAEDYIGTGIAWGMSKGLRLEWLEHLNKFLLKEDFAILLEGERHVRSIEKNHVHEQNNVLVERARENFLLLAERYSWKKLRLSRSKKESAELIWETVRSYLEKR